jgi:hypothetical protein
MIGSRTSCRRMQSIQRCKYLQVDQWIPLAAQKQRRDPIRLTPRPLYSNIIVRPVNVQGGGALAAGWRELIDEPSQRAYYWNEATGVTQWERPASSSAASCYLCAQLARLSLARPICIMPISILFVSICLQFSSFRILFQAAPIQETT